MGCLLCDDIEEELSLRELADQIETERMGHLPELERGHRALAVTKQRLED